ncbi:MAG: hypothetical protein AAF502_17720 [Bacteroidota bacterium]
MTCSIPHFSLQPKAVITMVFPLLFALNLSAQNSNNIYVVDFESDNKGNFEISNPLWITADNQDGYNNQPYFIDSILFVTAQWDDTQTDIFAYDLASRTRYQMTNSPESEYSPTPMPDEKAFSVVRVSADTNQYQQLWRVSYNLTSRPTLIMDRVYNVGYHLWLDEGTVMMFIVGNPRHRLNIYDVKEQTFKPVASNIGRCFKISPKGYPCFVDKSLTDDWFIKEYNPATREFKVIAETLPGSEDFEFTPDGYILMGKGQYLYSLKTYEEYKWVPIADLSHWGINNITRMAYGFGKLAIVTN